MFITPSRRQATFDCSVILSVLCLWISGFGLLDVASAQKVEVELVVESPANTPSESVLYVAGNIDSLGPWQPNVFALKKDASGLWRGTIPVPKGTTLEYKYTQGSWASVEKDADGAEITNRRVVVDGKKSVRDRIEAWAVPEAAKQSTATGELRWREIESSILSGPRRISVWLPPGYGTQADPYPVLYMLDGQNAFDTARSAFGQEWRADETARDLISKELVAPFLIVAIDNSVDRIEEYTPMPANWNDRIVGGKADQHLRFLADELQPFIARSYHVSPRSKDHVLCGSSLGGLFVLHTLLQQKSSFGGGIAMSPSLTWADGEVVRRFQSLHSELNANPNTNSRRLWVDCGTNESNSALASQALVGRFLELKKSLEALTEDKVIQARFELAQDARHNEEAWAKRLPAAIQFVFGPK